MKTRVLKKLTNFTNFGAFQNLRTTRAFLELNSIACIVFSCFVSGTNSTPGGNFHIWMKKRKKKAKGLCSGQFVN